ncbi:TNF receptor-associated factor 6 [Fopius arisanus]|uniref:TNF receptor-associated factor 6 n=1 Tax=Fopius arisanus TaxID=64838 RepID=A0A9R1T7P6_9HYME|nr:PREDICTED: TNF receptor-associated factor 6 [Fopius arisanus]
MSEIHKELRHAPEENPENQKIDEISSRILESRFECPICLSCMRDPILTSCGHRFCSKCLHKWLEEKSNSCPVDSTPLKPENGDLFLDRYTKREISQYKTKCPYHQFGCDVELSPIDMDSHINDCEFKKNASRDDKIYCDFKYVGCTEAFEEREDLQRHLEVNHNIHLMMMGKTMEQMIISQSEVNKNARDSKLWDPPPKNNREQLQTEKSQSNVEQLLKDLYERIVVLEQQNREQSIIISNQKTTIMSIQNSLTHFGDESLRNCNGIYIWRIDGFTQKITEMMAESMMLYSDEFYTHKNGYKVCGRMNISKKNIDFLSIVLHLVPSENDDALDWPFIGVISFILVHPEDSDKSIRERTYSVPNLEAFKRPGAERNRRSFGYTEFISLDELPNFTRNDRLIFRIEVKASDRFESSHLNEQENCLG